MITASHDCGWTGGPYRSQAQADYALRRHSCKRHHERVERAARTNARLNADGPTRPCQHNDRHAHGTHARYVLDACRCRACRDASAAYERRRYRDIAYGRPRLVDATESREHIHALQAAGMGWKTIATAAGVGHNVVGKILYGDPRRNMGPSKRVRPDTAAKILAVKPGPLSGVVVDGTGTVRRLQALSSLGWTSPQLANRIGHSPANFTKLVHGRRDTTIATRDAVTRLYDELWNTPPPQDTHRDRIAASRARNAARAAGWAPPLAWDDDTIDDPAATPHIGHQPRPTGGTGRPSADTAEDVEFLLDADATLTVEQAAHRLGISGNSLHTALHRAGRDDLRHRLIRNTNLHKKGSAA